jgi:hypothetical protein
MRRFIPMKSKLKVVFFVLVLICAVGGNQVIFAEAGNLVPNPSFEEPNRFLEEMALNWGFHVWEYTRTNEASYSGQWSLKISGIGGEKEVGLGGAVAQITNGLPAQAAMTLTANIYIPELKAGKVFPVYFVVEYTDGAAALGGLPALLSANGKWETYSATLITDPSKTLSKVNLYCMVWHDDNKNKFNGTVYFDNLNMVIEEGIDKVRANFNYSINKSEKTVSFLDASAVAYVSQNAVAAWNWDFGDGNTSDEQNITHTYSKSGDYEVVLTVETTSGDKSVVTKKISI